MGAARSRAKEDTPRSGMGVACHEVVLSFEDVRMLSTPLPLRPNEYVYFINAVNRVELCCS